jgi:hypothetical protein
MARLFPPTLFPVTETHKMGRLQWALAFLQGYLELLNGLIIKAHFPAGNPHLEIEIGVDPARPAHILELFQNFIKTKNLFGADLFGDLDCSQRLLLRLTQSQKALGFR